LFNVKPMRLVHIFVVAFQLDGALSFKLNQENIGANCLLDGAHFLGSNNKILIQIVY